MSNHDLTAYRATRNACKLCAPLGASLAFKGIAGGVPLLHGSQGCSTYIRRYLISHFKEPVDIACSNFAEETAIFGGGANLKIGIENIRKQYRPDLIGIATTCLSETIGDDVPLFLKEYRGMIEDKHVPPIIHVSTASYRGTHMDGFHGAIRSTVDALAQGGGGKEDHINLFPGMLSPEDLRYLKEILSDFEVPYVMLPDYSQSLDGPLWDTYQPIPKGGTWVDEIRKMGTARMSIEFGRILAGDESGGKLLKERYHVPCISTGLPIGVKETDRFFNALENATGRSIPKKYNEERGRLLDAYVDAHKHISQVRAVVYGEEDLVVGLTSFLSEIGIIPVLCASGGRSGRLKEKIGEVYSDFSEEKTRVVEGADFMTIEEEAASFEPDIFVGNSKGYSAARRLGTPLIRVGFPIHDRVGGARILHIGYRGAQRLFDRIVNRVIETKQDKSNVGYSYM